VKSELKLADATFVRRETTSVY